MLSPGSQVPEVVLTNQHGDTIDVASLRGTRVLIFFYPKANTPGCTQQACGLRDVAGEVDDTVIIGISPDKPAAQKKFDDKFSLGFDLLADTEHTVAEAFGVWQEKVNYGKRYMGIVRSAFLVDANGVIEHAWYKISPADTPKRLLEALAK
jgi:peroxiredoxin Q/BCP